MRILIYGGGAVGLGIASCLLKAGQEVVILAREKTARLLRREGLYRTGIFGNMVATGGSFGAISTLADLSPGRFDAILVCTKSFDTEQAAREIEANRAQLGEPDCIVLFQNGWGNAEIFARYVPPESIFNGRVITGFIRPAPNRVEVTVHADAIHVGSLYSASLERIDPLCRAITAGDIPCRPTPEIEKDLWAKMLFNCPLNPLGAVLGVSYGALGASGHTRKVMQQIIREIFDIMQAGDYSTYWSQPEAYLAYFFDELIPRTAEHYASTLQDLRAGKRTEIDALNGAIVRLGAGYGLAVPANESAYRLVKFLEGSHHRPVEPAAN